MFTLYLLVLLSTFIMFSTNMLFLIFLSIKYILSVFNLMWNYCYLVCSSLMLVVLSLMLGSLPFIYIVGSSVTFLFIVSFVIWFVGFNGGFYLMIRYYHNMSLMIIFLLLFDLFVVLLRPVTLTLRVFINVTLGHYLIMMLHLGGFWLVLIVWVVELFVYTVQSYVFMTLTISYTNLL